jgi:streptogramin lyase
LEGIAASYGAVWIADEDQSTVWQIDPRTYRVVRKIHVRPTDNYLVTTTDYLAAGAGKIWVSSFTDGGLERIDPATGSVELLETPDVIDSILFTPVGIWASDSSTQSFALFDPASGRIVRSIPATQNAVPFAYADGALWSVDVAGNVYRLPLTKK